MITKTNSKFSVYFSFKKCSIFVFIYIFLIILLLGNIAAVVLLILKPRMPVFSLQKIDVESYKIDVNNSDQNIFVSSVSYLILDAENPNKVRLSYGPSRFHVLSEGLVIGLIRIPQFHQPPLSKNVSVQMQLSFECMNISHMIASARNSSKDSNIFQIKISGEIRAQVGILNITFPKLKIALDCEISTSHLSLRDEVYSMRWIKNNNMVRILNLLINFIIISALFSHRSLCFENFRFRFL